MFKLKKNILFSQVAKEWLYLKKTKIKYSSYIKYEALILKHLIPYFDTYEMIKIDSCIISQFIETKYRDEHLSTSSLKILLYLIKSIVFYTNEKYRLSIYISRIELPSKNKKLRLLDKNEQKQIESYCFLHHDILSLSILLSLYGGLRIGEICALQLDNIDIDRGVVLISQTVQRIKSQSNRKKTELLIGPPKTSTSHRIVPIPRFLLSHIKENYQNYFQHEYYLLSKNHKPIDPRCIQTQFQRLCKQLDIQVNFHALRHTYATNCVQKGVDVKSLSEIMGHSSVNIILNLYVHSSDEFKIRQIQKLDKSVA